MCGRFTQTKTRQEVLEHLAGIELPPLFHGRYNVAPTQTVAMIHQNNPSQAIQTSWGFDNPRGGIVINARSETLLQKPMFKDLVASNRCLIPADGFYEWKGKEPHYFQLPDHELFAFAGLFRNGRCVILTRAADNNMRGIHDRMPIILRRPDWGQWRARYQLLEPPNLCERTVSRRVNRVANDDPTCLDPGESQIDLSLFPDDE